MSEKGLEIFEESIQKFKEFVETVTHKLKAQNFKFKDEISVQQKLQEELQGDIENLQIQKEKFLLDSKKQVDPRRNVFNLKECMTCTPDMDIVLA